MSEPGRTKLFFLDVLRILFGFFLGLVFTSFISIFILAFPNVSRRQYEPGFARFASGVLAGMTIGVPIHAVLFYLVFLAIVPGALRRF